MKCKLIKDIFINFFKTKKHKIIPSFPICLDNDNLNFFVNAGMSPFKKYFIGEEIPIYTRIANSQRCLRVTGKHNDFDQVGYDNYHHTMFEMLGSWSFGDYYREKAIKWAWELLVDVYKIPKNDIYISIFNGNYEDKLPIDKETFKYWSYFVSNNNNILFFGKEYNFWEMGDSGPCGPCTEIHVDLRSHKEKKIIPGKNLVNKNHPKVIEVWNLVFIEFLRKLDGKLTPLPIKHVDTGMGLERLCMILQEKDSSYDTDIFSNIIYKIKEFISVNKYNYENNFSQNIAIRILVDHLRAVIFSIYDGQLPSNNKAGYIIRKILRRAIIYINRFLNIKSAFIYKFAEIFIEENKNLYPELKKQKEHIKNIIKKEEILFFKVIKNGNKKIYHIIEQYKKKNKNIIDGEIIFKLYDTYGFPIEISKIIIESNELSIDEKKFNKKLLEQKVRSKNANNLKIFKDKWIKVYKYIYKSEDYEDSFIGYNNYIKYNNYIIKYRKVLNTTKENYYYELVLFKTPFYPEGGGQIGDTGYLLNNDEKIFVFDTKKENSSILHCVKKLPNNILSKFTTYIKKKRRKQIEINHTSTHLLKFFLKKILGNHVEQKGSYISNDYIRFDFTHNKKISWDEMNKIEYNIQKSILLNIPLKEEIFECIDKKTYNNFLSKKLKNEKKFRKITFGESSEWCIGTHVNNTGKIKVLKIISEKSISNGIRRIKAITYDKAIQYLNEISIKYNLLKKSIKSSYTSDTNKYKKENKKLNKNIHNIYSKQTKILENKYKKEIKHINSIKCICDIEFYKYEFLNEQIIKNVMINLKKEILNLFMFVGFIENNKCFILITTSCDIIKHKNIKANKIINKIKPYINGKYFWGDSYFSGSSAYINNDTNYNNTDKLYIVYNYIKQYIKKIF